eukprot:953833-Alexandrium_andersonii.AAC.1
MLPRRPHWRVMQDASLGGSPGWRWSCAWQGPESSRHQPPRPRGTEHPLSGEHGPHFSVPLELRSS